MTRGDRSNHRRSTRVLFSVGLGSLLLLPLGASFERGQASETKLLVQALLPGGAPSGGVASLAMSANVDTDADSGFKPDDHPLARAMHMQPADAGVIPDAGQPRKKKGHKASSP